MTAPGQIVILNGAPRSGKTSIARAIQASSNEPWMNLGVDLAIQATPPHLRPGIGLRPGGERPDLEPFVVVAYRALYASVAAHSMLGLNVVVDVGHHDAYSKPLGILRDAAERLSGLPVLLVGVRCPLDVILSRRAAPGSAGRYDSALEPIERWQVEVHRPGIYDLEVDTSVSTPEECAAVIWDRLDGGATDTALARIRS
ncbi:MAG: chloramphenicol phosphotransferase CPT family protein [Chloroflexota bacterium]